MSGWELFTWANTLVLGLGAALVFALFLRDLPRLLRRTRTPAAGESGERSRRSQGGGGGEADPTGSG